MNERDFWNSINPQAKGFMEYANDVGVGQHAAAFLKNAVKRLEEALADASPETKNRLILGLALQPFIEACVTPDASPKAVDAMRVVSAGLIDRAIELASLSKAMEEAEKPNH